MKKNLLITLPIVFVAIIAAITITIARRPKTPISPEPAPEPRLQTAEDVRARVAARIAERAADTNYMAGLDMLASRYRELGEKLGEAHREFAEWQRGYLASNTQARSLAVEIAKLASEAKEEAAQELESMRDGLKKLCAEDARGAYLLDKISKIEAAIKGNQEDAKVFIGSRLRDQAAQHAGEERAAAKEDYEARAKLGLVPKSNTNILRKASSTEVATPSSLWTNAVVPAAK